MKFHNQGGRAMHLFFSLRRRFRLATVASVIVLSSTGCAAQGGFAFNDNKEPQRLSIEKTCAALSESLKRYEQDSMEDLDKDKSEDNWVSWTRLEEAQIFERSDLRQGERLREIVSVSEPSMTERISLLSDFHLNKVQILTENDGYLPPDVEDASATILEECAAVSVDLGYGLVW